MILNTIGIRKNDLLPLIGWMLMFCYSVEVEAQAPTASARPRIIVTADPELDDNNSLIRFLLYSSDLEIEGLIYASSQFHWKGDGKGTKWFVPGREYARFGMDLCPCESWRWAEDERFIHDIVDAYGTVYPNLKTHNPNYPSPDQLRSKIRYGNIEFDGDISKDSPGSNLIRSLILDDKPGQLFITAWGGKVLSPGRSNLFRSNMNTRRPGRPYKIKYRERWYCCRPVIRTTLMRLTFNPIGRK